jgi:pimeloyl-ACP methyl ester carboxylesterase
MLKEKMFDTGPVKLNYVEGPDSGPPLVLLHGIGHRWQAFLSIMPALAARWHIYAMDFRGHGRSGRTPGAYRGTGYVVDAVAFLQNIVKEPAVIFGHSLGGIVGMWLASSLGQQVRGLILGDNVLTAQSLAQNEHLLALYAAIRDLAQSGRLLDDLAEALADIRVTLPGKKETVRWGQFPGMDAALFRFLAQTYSQMDPEVFTALFEGRATDGWDADTMFRQIKCPVLLLQANPALGGSMSDADVRTAVGLLPRVTHVRMIDFGHLLHLQRPEPVARVVMNFLESL